MNSLMKFVTAVAIAVLLAACDQAPRQAASPPLAPTVGVGRPIERMVMEWDEYTGRFDAADMVEVRARISGVLEEVHFKDGDFVKKGDLLLVIDPRPFQRVLEKEKANVAAAQVNAEFTGKDFERAQPLAKSSAISEQTLDQRTQAARQAAANVRSAEASLHSAELDVEFTRLTAPISGRISRKLVSEGNYVTGGSGTGTLLTSIVSTDPIYFYFDLSQGDYLKYKRLGELNGAGPAAGKEPVYLALQDETGFPHRGTMDFVDNRIDAATGSLRVRAVFENPNGLFSPGLFARIRHSGSGEHAVILLPDTAVASDQSNRVVYVVADDGSWKAKPVQLGPLSDGLRIVRSGVDTSDKVILSGLMPRPGTKVKPEEKQFGNTKAAALP
jgi:RND family efflux transporter MFP subunit